ncbi:mannonate dehydratase [Jannaschia aquimarina]|uniref:Mannonate dehydratase n=1 Tax=Jannaschia aquimarina TaxID=935700 RepID=A0A0D1EDI0_9RHOB|nr:mannonate dehydratase [Jannaschia aquimarina]KIT14996.1 Mannonate dehydratase [Jannaschia aquimarina]SNS61523.1 D-mannonate dehydratase [Jannaschia aquimarina]
MKQTWRWFGPNDPIPLAYLKQAGVEGVVTALHDVPPGEVWTSERIARRVDRIAQAPGHPTLDWTVAESLPVSEAIKTKGPDRATHIAAYRESLRNLAAAGVEVVCYNFMPVLDWTRTELNAPMSHGGTAMAFDLARFVAFDVHILARPGARDDYGEAILDAADQLSFEMSDTDRGTLLDTIVKGLPGAAESWGLSELRERLSAYDAIDATALRSNLDDFLADVIPESERLGLRLCCHPDDPPFPLLGLPRIVSSRADYKRLVDAVPSPANGITFCTGSPGVADDFDGAAFVEALGGHIHFVHLRNTRRREPRDGLRVGFHEAEHLDGDTDMVATIRALMREQARRLAEGRTDWRIPMRPDHGQTILTDDPATATPGYPLAGRARGLAEIRGVMAACA